jgi:hypothetical protein
LNELPVAEVVQELIREGYRFLEAAKGFLAALPPESAS